jgi:hypothetical protein
MKKLAVLPMPFPAVDSKNIHERASSLHDKSEKKNW